MTFWTRDRIGKTWLAVWFLGYPAMMFLNLLLGFINSP